jgi:hypothetical protein
MTVSKRNSDRAKFNREHKKRMRRRKRERELRMTLGSKTAGREVSIPTEDGNQIASSHLRQLTGDNNAYSDQGGIAFEIVVYKSPSGKTDD